MRSRRRQTAALHAFRVRVEPGSSLYARVLVFKSPAVLRRAMREVGADEQAAKTIGFCQGVVRRKYPRGRRARTSGEFCTIGLTLESRVTVITHECFHAAFRWAGRRGFTVVAAPSVRHEERHDMATEERMAGVCDTLAREIVHKFFALGILT